MGAISFSLDATLARLMQRELRCDIFFESGGFEGDTITVVKALFDRVISVELAPAYAQGLRARFAREKNVEIVEGDSATTLEKMNSALRDARVLYWLDAHWCDANAVDAAIHQCPLLRELRALGNLNAHSAVIIDDARLFLAPPLAPHEVSDWPTWSQISRLIEANAGLTHDVMVVNDCIIIFPRAMHSAMAEYAQTSGADWLKIADLSREHATILTAAEDRLRLINELHEAAGRANSRVVELRSTEDQLLERQRAVTVRMSLMQTELDAKEGAIQAMAAAAVQRDERLRLLQAQQEVPNSSLREKDEVIFEIEMQRSVRERQFALTMSTSLATHEQNQALQVSALHTQEQLTRLTSVLTERDCEICLIRDHSVQLRAEDTERRIISSRQIASLEQTVDELRATTAVLQAEATERASILKLAADAFGQSAQRSAVSLEPEALALVSASAKHWQQQAIEKEAIIRNLDTAVAAFRAAQDRPALPIRMWRHGKASVERAIRPKLGVLNQHPPIPLGDRKISLRRPLPAEQLPTISIVTPSFRQAHMIERTIASVVNQQYPKLEYFIQDGGSDDGTTSVLKKWADQLTGWESSRDGGQSAAINLGFAKTAGEIMAWLNSDDLLMPGSLNYVAAYFRRHPDVDVVYGNRLLIDEDDALIGRWVLPGHADSVLPWADFVPQETLFWRRTMWEKVGGQIDESFRFAMDWDLLLRFRKAGARFAHRPVYLGAFRIHAKQKTSAAINEIGFQEMSRLRRREFGRDVTRDEIRRALAPFMARHLVADKLMRFR